MSLPARLLLWCLVAVFPALAVLCRGQEEPPVPIPPMPAEGLLDAGNVFNTEELPLMLASMQEFRKRSGMELGVCTVNYLHGVSTPEEFGKHLVGAWLKGKSGVVMVYERGSNQLAWSATPGIPGQSRAGLRALFQAGSRAATSRPEGTSAAHRLRAAVEALTTVAAAWRESGTPPVAADIPVAGGATLPEDPPGGFLADAGRFFEPDPAVALQSRMMSFHAQHDVDLYLVTLDQTAAGQAQSVADTLAATWLPGRKGAVIVMERTAAETGGPPGIAGSPEAVEFLKPEVFAQASALAGEQAEAGHKAGDSPGQQLVAAAEILMQTFADRAVPVVEEPEGLPVYFRVIRALAMAFVAGMTILFLFHRVQERLEARSRDRYFFPDVTVGRRLGSPHGGGQVAGISFGTGNPEAAAPPGGHVRLRPPGRHGSRRKG